MKYRFIIHMDKPYILTSPVRIGESWAIVARAKTIAETMGVTVYIERKTDGELFQLYGKVLADGQWVEEKGLVR